MAAHDHHVQHLAVVKRVPGVGDDRFPHFSLRFERIGGKQQNDLVLGHFLSGVLVARDAVGRRRDGGLAASPRPGCSGFDPRHAVDGFGNSSLPGDRLALVPREKHRRGMGEAFGHFQARLGQGAFEVPLEFQKDEIVLLALDRHDIVDVPDAGLDVAVGDGVDFYGVLVGDAAGEQKARRKQGVQAGPWKRHGYGLRGESALPRCRALAASGIPPWAGFCSGRDGGTLRGCLGVTCGWGGAHRAPPLRKAFAPYARPPLSSSHASDNQAGRAAFPPRSFLTTAQP